MHGYPQRRDFQFEVDGKATNLALSLDPNVNRKFEMSPHSYAYTGRLPRDWRTDYYKMFLQHRDDEATLRQILDQLRQLGGGEDEMVERVVAFVQGAISYDYATAHNIDQGQIRYPYETLWDGTGVCSDKSMLLAKLLLMLGYGVSIMSFERANHMAVGLKVPREHGQYRTEYAFVESTNYTRIGTVPERYAGGIRLDGRPQMVVVGGHKVYQQIAAQKQEEARLTSEFGKDYLNMNTAQRGLHERLTAMKAELKASERAIRGCKGTLPPDKYEECRRLTDKHNALVAEYNRLAAEFNRS
ncbi:MAG: transglutaminase-like domain-containing protein [Bacteroidota bacterium]